MYIDKAWKVILDWSWCNFSVTNVTFILWRVWIEGVRPRTWSAGISEHDGNTVRSCVTPRHLHDMCSNYTAQHVQWKKESTGPASISAVCHKCYAHHHLVMYVWSQFNLCWERPTDFSKLFLFFFFCQVLPSAKKKKVKEINLNVKKPK